MQDKVLYRHELKYLISETQMQVLYARVRNVMSLDSHVGETGRYIIRSVYFDDYNNGAYYENEDGIDPREKFRIRIYDVSDKIIKLECKRKERDKTFKKSCSLPKETTCNLLNSLGFVSSENPPLLNKLCLQMSVNLLHPVVIVNYERIPFICPEGNVRVTFDKNIASSSDVQGFFSANIPLRPVLPKGYHLLEVKYDDFLPTEIYSSLQIEELQRTAFSKYYLCRKYSIKKI